MKISGIKDWVNMAEHLGGPEKVFEKLTANKDELKGFNVIPTGMRNAEGEFTGLNESAHSWHLQCGLIN